MPRCHVHWRPAHSATGLETLPAFFRQTSVSIYRYAENRRSRRRSARTASWSENTVNLNFNISHAPSRRSGTRCWLDAPCFDAAGYIFDTSLLKAKACPPSPGCPKLLRSKRTTLDPEDLGGRGLLQQRQSIPILPGSSLRRQGLISDKELQEVRRTVEPLQLRQSEGAAEEPGNSEGVGRPEKADGS